MPFHERTFHELSCQALFVSFVEFGDRLRWHHSYTVWKVGCKLWSKERAVVRRSLLHCAWIVSLATLKALLWWGQHGSWVYRCRERQTSLFTKQELFQPRLHCLSCTDSDLIEVTRQFLQFEDTWLDLKRQVMLTTLFHWIVLIEAQICTASQILRQVVR